MVPQRSLATRSSLGMLLCLLVVALVSQASAEEQARSVYLPVFGADARAAAALESLTIRAEGLDLQVQGRNPIDSRRPLLIILDPYSMPRADARRRMAVLADTLAALDPFPPVRIGIPVLDGILGPTVNEPAGLRREFEGAIQSYFPDRLESNGASVGRFFDLVVSLIRAAQAERGALDCLVVAHDRPPEDTEDEYLLHGFERKLLQVVSERGSVLYGYLDGTGLWDRLCNASGGEWLPSSARASTIVERIVGGRERGWLIETRIAGKVGRTGRFPTDYPIRFEEGEEPGLRGPQAIWLHRRNSEAPDYYRMRQGLDWMRRSRESEAEGNLTLALRFMETATQEDPWNGDAVFQAGRISALTGDLQRAAAFLDEAIRFRPVDREALLLFGSVQTGRGAAGEAVGSIRREIPAGSLRQRAVAPLLHAMGRHHEARTLYASLLGSDEDDDTLRAEYGWVLRALNEEEAKEQFTQSLRVNARNPGALAGMSDVALAEGDLNAAAGYARRALEIAPESADSHLQAGKVELARGNLEAAGVSLRSALRFAPYRHDILIRLVDLEVERKRTGEAMRLLMEAQAGQPSSPAIYRKIAELHAQNGNMGSAVAVLEAGASRATMRVPELYREAAGLRERRGEYGQALLDYRAMLRSSSPDEAEEWGNKISSHLAYLTLVLGGDPGTARYLDIPEGMPVMTRTDGTPEPPQGSEPQGLRVPGGIALLARTLGLDPAQLRDPQAVEKVFSFILEAAPSHSSKLKDHPIRRDVVAYLKEYDALIRHLVKKRLLAPDSDASAPQTLVFRLMGAKEDRESAKQVLSFFGVRYQYERTKSGNVEVTLNLKQNRRYAERQKLLRNMGVNLLDPQIRDVRLVIGDEELPLILGRAAWTEKILGKDSKDRKTLLERMILSPGVLRLYVALAECSDAVREAIVAAAVPGELPDHAEVLLTFGRFLDFRDGSLTLPGSPEAWARLIGQGPQSGGASLLRPLVRFDEGKGLLLYAVLSGASQAVQEHLTASPERLARFYSLLPQDFTRLIRAGGSRVWYDVAQLLSQMKADEHGLYLDIDHRFRKHLIRGAESSPIAPAQEPGPLRLDLTDLSRLFRLSEVRGPQGSLGLVEVLEFLRHVRMDNPDILTDRAIAAIMKDSTTTPVFLDLVWNLHPDDELIVRYLDYCRKLAALDSREWNAHRTRTSQALFYLLSALERQGTITREEGRGLLGDLLGRLSQEHEAGFAWQVTGFLSDRLLPLVRTRAGGEDPSEILWRGLAGPAEVREVALDGRELLADMAGYKLQRMLSAVQQQRYNPLGAMLELYAALERVRSDGASAEAVQTAMALFGRVQTVEFDSGEGKGLRQGVARANLADLRQRWDLLLSGDVKSRRPGMAQTLAIESAAALHVELGVTLLTYCYGYAGTPETDALVFDPRFVRKHSFYPSTQAIPGGWTTARLEEREELGSLLTGSLSGLSFELGRLETSQAVQSFGKREGKSLVPTLLNGIRTMRRPLLTDRAQEYVALVVRLGREILVLSALDSGLSRWCTETLERLVSPRRRELLRAEIESGNPAGAAEHLSPSELFFLAESYLDYQGLSAGRTKSSRAGVVLAAEPRHSYWAGRLGSNDFARAADHRPDTFAPKPDCPVLDRVEEILPEPDSAEARRFREEVEQYGVLLRRRAGLHQLSLSVEDSYEQLERSTREDLLHERLCDLKIRIAELAYSLALPAAITELVGEMALRDILPKTGEVRTSSWKLVVEQVSRLGPEHVRGWIEELLNRGALNLPVGTETNNR